MMHPNNNFTQINIGDVYMVRFDGNKNEQSGYRPGLIIQNNTGNKYSPNVIVLPLTTSIKKVCQPTHVVVYAKDSGLLKDSMVLCENPERMSKVKLEKYITTLPNKYMCEIAEAFILATSIISFLPADSFKGLWQKAARLNCVS